MSAMNPETNTPLFNRDPLDGGPGYRKTDGIVATDTYRQPEFAPDPVGTEITGRLRRVLGGKALPSYEAGPEIDKSVFQLPAEIVPSGPTNLEIAYPEQAKKDDEDRPHPADERQQNPDGTYDF